MKNKFIATVLGLVWLTLTATVVFAAAGDPVPPGSITPPGPAGVGCGGIGVAFDGATIWYTCADETKIRKTNLAGADLGFIDTAEGATPVSVDAIAWDPTEGKIWGGELVDTDATPGNDTCRIYSIDPATGAATTRFSYVDPHGGCDFFYYDGLTVDSVTGTLWTSPDVHGFIHHKTKAGVEIGADLIDFAFLTPLGEPDVNSGLAMGLDGSLFAGTNGFSKIFQLNPGPPASLVGLFSTVNGRDEDLECGPVTDGKETILSREFFSGAIAVLEAPKGTCVSPVRPLIPACTETVNPNGKTVPPAGSTTLPGPKGGQNEDGFYKLSIAGKFPLGTTLWITDALGSGPFGPFLPGDKVKTTEAPGGTPSIKKIGSGIGQAGAIVAHITLKGDPLVFVLDPAGNKSGAISCLVPPPPK